MKQLVLWLLCLGTVLSSFAGQLKIGWSSKELWDGKTKTLITGQMYPRWNRDGALDPLTSTALVIDNGSDCVVFVSMDVTSISEEVTKALMEALAKDAPEVPLNKLLAGATHTHTTGNIRYRATPPVFKKLGLSRNGFRDYAIKQTVLAIKEAWNNRKPGLIGYGYGYAVVAHQRRAVYFHDKAEIAKKEGKLGNALTDGFAKMYGKTNDPDFSHHETGADAAVNFLFTFDLNKKLTGAIINIPCPSQCSESMYQLSADYWNDIRVALRAKYGKDLQILPQCAAAGDLSPHLRTYQQAAKRKWKLKYGRNEARYQDEFNRMDIAERVAAAFDEVYSWAQKETFSDLPIENRRVELKLERFKPGEAEYQNAKYLLKQMPKTISAKEITAIKDPKARRKAQTRNSMYHRAKGVIEKYENFDPAKTFDTYAQIVRIGNVAFASNAFELYMDYMHRIQARSPFEQTFIVQLAAPGGGRYLGTERTMKNRGYGGVAASCAVSPKGGQQIVDTTVEVLKQMHGVEEAK